MYIFIVWREEEEDDDDEEEKYEENPMIFRDLYLRIILFKFGV